MEGYCWLLTDLSNLLCRLLKPQAICQKMGEVGIVPFVMRGFLTCQNTKKQSQLRIIMPPSTLVGKRTLPPRERPEASGVGSLAKQGLNTRPPLQSMQPCVISAGGGAQAHFVETPSPLLSGQQAGLFQIHLY